MCGNCKHWRKIRDTDQVVNDEITWRGTHGECMRLSVYPEANDTAWLDSWLGPTDANQPVINAKRGSFFNHKT